MISVVVFDDMRPYCDFSLVDGYRMCQRRKNGKTPLDLATDDACRELLKHHAFVDAMVNSDSATLVASARGHCSALSASEELVPATALSLRAHQLDPAFLWAPPAARAAVSVWARNAYMFQLLANTPPFDRLPDDCACDVTFFEGEMTRTESLHIATHCSSPEALSWVRAVLDFAFAAVSVRAVISLDKSSAYYLETLASCTRLFCASLWFFPLLLRQRQRLSWCQQLERATWQPCKIAFQRKPALTYRCGAFHVHL
jgi:hypothetical protein